MITINLLKKTSSKRRRGASSAAKLVRVGIVCVIGLAIVVAGAGFGIFSTKFAYWVFPKIKKLFFKDIRVSFSLMPSFDFRNGPVR